MRIFFNHNTLDSYHNDSCVKFGIGWYRHHKSHKWFGITIELYLLYWVVSGNFVSNYKEYRKRMDWKHSDHLREDLAAKLAARKLEKK